MAFDRLPGPLARTGSATRVIVAVLGIVLGVALIALGGGLLEGDAPAPASVVVPTTSGS